MSYENDATAVVSRVSVDIDSHVSNVRLRVLTAVSGLKRAGAFETKVAVSSSGNGFHVVGHFDRHVTDDERFTLRRDLQDDPNRVWMDEQRHERGLPTGTMWHEKGANQGHRAEFDTAEEAFGHASLGVDWAERAKNVQNRGHKAVTDTFVPHLQMVSADN